MFEKRLDTMEPSAGAFATASADEATSISSVLGQSERCSTVTRPEPPDYAEGQQVQSSENPTADIKFRFSGDSRALGDRSSAASKRGRGRSASEPAPNAYNREVLAGVRPMSTATSATREQNAALDVTAAVNGAPSKNAVVPSSCWDPVAASSEIEPVCYEAEPRDGGRSPSIPSVVHSIGLEDFNRALQAQAEDPINTSTETSNTSISSVPKSERAQNEDSSSSMLVSPRMFESPLTAPPYMSTPRGADSMPPPPPLASPSPTDHNVRRTSQIASPETSMSAHSYRSWAASPRGTVGSAPVVIEPSLFAPALTSPIVQNRAPDHLSSKSPSTSPLLGERDGLFIENNNPGLLRYSRSRNSPFLGSLRGATTNPRRYSRSSSMVTPNLSPDMLSQVKATSPLPAYRFRRQRSLPVKLEARASPAPSSGGLGVALHKAVPFTKTRSDIFRPRTSSNAHSVNSNKSIPQNLTGITESDDEETNIRMRRNRDDSSDDEESSLELIVGNGSADELHRRGTSPRSSSDDIESAATLSSKKSSPKFKKSDSDPPAHSDIATETVVSVSYLSACAVLGTSTRLAVAQWMRNAGVTSAPLIDLPANALGSAIMGAVVVDMNPDLLFTSAVGVGLCGSITTLSSWNTQMVKLLFDGQVLPALAGYLVGFQTAHGSYTGGRQLACWVRTFWRNNIRIDSSHLVRGGSALTIVAAVALMVTYGILGHIFDDAWFRKLLASCLWSPFGVLIRWQLSERLNHRGSYPFPSGTWIANVLGSIISAVASANGWDAVGLGFAGSLSTVSSLVKEVHIMSVSSLPAFHAWVYVCITLISCALVGTGAYAAAGGTND